MAWCRFSTSVAWALAVGGSWLALTFSASQAAPQLPYWHLKMDVRLLGTLAAIALVTTGLFGLAPAWRVSDVALAASLSEGPHSTTGPGPTVSVRLA